MTDTSDDRLATLREGVRRALRFMLNFLNANGDAHLQLLATKAQSKVERADLHAGAREWEIRRARVGEHFMQAVLAGFDAFVPASNAGASAAKSGLPFELALEPKGLGLVHDDHLQESLAVETLAKRALMNHRDALVAMVRQVMQQTGQRNLDPEALPVAPPALAQHFFAAVDAAEVRPDARAACMKLFSRFVLDELPPFYTECLKGIAVEPQPDAIEVVEEPAPAVADALSITELPIATRVEEEFLDAPLRNMPEITWDTSNTPLLAPPGKAMAFPQDLLDELLLGLQRAPVDGGKSLAGLNPKAGILPFEIYELLNASLAERGYQKPMAVPVDLIEAVNLVRLLFERVLRDQRIVSPARRLLRMLQIPLLRASLHDTDVLTTSTHPVRVFLGELTEAVIGWVPLGELASDGFFRALQHAVGRIVTGYGSDVAVFTTSRAEFRGAMRSIQVRQRLLEQHAAIAELGSTERDAVRVSVVREISSLLGDATVPRVVGDFLRGAWSDALFVISLQYGADSPLWADAIRTTSALLAVATRRPGADISAVAPGVLGVLRTLGLDEDSAAAEMRTLEQALGSTGVVASTVRARAEPSAEYLQQADKLAPDTWIEFRLPGVAARRARLLTKYPKTGEFVFVNGDGSKVGDWKHADLAAALQAGDAVVVAGPNAQPSARRP